MYIHTLNKAIKPKGVIKMDNQINELKVLLKFMEDSKMGGLNE